MIPRRTIELIHDFKSSNYHIDYIILLRVNSLVMYKRFIQLSNIN